MKKCILFLVFFFITVLSSQAEVKNWNQLLYDAVHFAENGNNIIVDIEKEFRDILGVDIK